MREEVLGFDAKFMSGFKDFQEGSWSTDIGWFEYVLNHCYFAPREEVEHNPGFKQIIPYVLFKSEDLYLAYERLGSESRLTGKLSTGIGGHVNLCDLNSTLVCEEFVMDILTMGALRELDEELDMRSMSASDKHFFINTNLERPRGYIYVNGSEVDQVHMGVIYKCILPSEMLNAVKLLDEGKNLVWKTKEDLLKDDRLENWSRIALQNVY